MGLHPDMMNGVKYYTRPLTMGGILPPPPPPPRLLPLPPLPIPLPMGQQGLPMMRGGQIRTYGVPRRYLLGYCPLGRTPVW